MKLLHSFFNSAYVNKDKEIVSRLESARTKKQRTRARRHSAQTMRVRAMLRRTGL